MIESAEQRHLHFCFKALADSTRLRMVGLLAKREHSAQELSSLLGVRPPTISHHLAKLREIGFLNLRTEGNQRFYRLHDENFAAFKDLVQRIETLAPDEPEDRDDAWIDALPLNDWEKKTIRDYTYAGRLRQIPAKRKKLMPVLKWLAMQFEEGVTYSEREVNAIISRHHDDYATLRRELVNFGFLRRERGGGKYWVAPEDEPIPEAE